MHNVFEVHSCCSILLGFSRKPKSIKYIQIYRKRFSMRVWLPWLWKLRSPTICHLQAGGLGKLLVQFQSKSEGLRIRGSQWCKSKSKPKGLRTRSASGWGQEKMDVPGPSDSEFVLPLPFCSIKVLKRLDDDHAKSVRLIFTQSTDLKANLF